MTTTRLAGSTWALEVTREMIDVTSDRPTPNESWDYMDRSGHRHRYDHGYPTLDLVIDAEHWCDGHVGIYNHDPHRAVDESHYECLICRETIQPSMNPPGWHRSIPGMTTATMTGTRSDGAELVVVLTGYEMDRIRSAINIDAVVQSILDTADERIVSLTFASR